MTRAPAVLASAAVLSVEASSTMMISAVGQCARTARTMVPTRGPSLNAGMMMLMLNGQVSGGVISVGSIGLRWVALGMLLVPFFAYDGRFHALLWSGGAGRDES